MKNFKFKKKNSSIKIKKTKVFVSGHFNVMHPGHLRFLNFAKKCGDHLIVGVENNKRAGNNVYVDEKIRLSNVKSINCVDEAFILKTSPKDYIKKNKPSIVVKGKEHESLFNEEANILKKYGGNLIFSSGEKIFSSIDLLNKEFKIPANVILDRPKDYIKRHSINNQKLKKIIKNFNRLNICVFGDLIIDEYIDCEPLGMSQEDPTLVINPINRKKFIGGAGIVAAHASSLGANVDFYSVTGRDELYKYSKKKLKLLQVNAKLFTDISRSTTLKQKFRSSGKTLLRVSNLNQNSISKIIQKKIYTSFFKNIKKYDLIVFSDFNYGCLTDELINKVTNQAKKLKIFMAADSQSSSQIGDITKYKNMNLLTPTEREARVGTRNQNDGLIILAEDLRKKTLAENIILKLAGEGLIIHKVKNKKWENDKIHALNSFPSDVAGAGDCLLIASSMSLASGANIWEASYLGSIASAAQVGKIGNIPIKREEILI
tara:strand:+ start:7511 stop:8971 length:1461 start_codon:yes stop_codon:yes gene_type:complete